MRRAESKVDEDPNTVYGRFKGSQRCCEVYRPRCGGKAINTCLREDGEDGVTVMNYHCHR
jgi:hypothetical protein